MTTPTCPVCKAKFPGREVCSHCGAPVGLSVSDVERYRVGRLMERDGISEKAAKRQLHRNRRPRKKHGRR